MRYCIHCGSALVDGGKFCPYCGQPVAQASAESTQQNDECPVETVETPKYVVNFCGREINFDSSFPSYNELRNQYLKSANEAANEFEDYYAANALFNFNVASVLSPEETANARAFAEQFMELVDAASMDMELAEAG